MSQRIAHLTAGETFTEGHFQVHSARVRQAATGPYLFLRLGDETGRISAINWNATDAEQKHALGAQAVFVSARVLFGAEAGGFQRQEMFEAELRRALDRAYTLGRNAPRQAPARPPFTVPIRFPVCYEGDLDNPFGDD